MPHTDRKPLETPSQAKRKLLRELSLFLFAFPSIHSAPQVCFPQAHPTVTPLGPQPYLQVPDKDWVDLISPARLAGSREVCLWCHRQKWSGSRARPPPSTPWAPLATTISPPGNARPWQVEPPSFPISRSNFIPKKDKGRLSPASVKSTVAKASVSRAGCRMAGCWGKERGVEWKRSQPATQENNPSLYLSTVLQDN